MKRGLSWTDVVKLTRVLPGIEVGTSYGTPGLTKADPKVFHITDHYRDYPAVLVRLDTAKPALTLRMLEESWRLAAPKKLVAQRDAR